jgi:hypothetical protein
MWFPAGNGKHRRGNQLVRFGRYDVLSSGIIVVWNVNGLSDTARCTPKLNQKKKKKLNWYFKHFPTLLLFRSTQYNSLLQYWQFLATYFRLLYFSWAEADNLVGQLICSLNSTRGTTEPVLCSLTTSWSQSSQFSFYRWLFMTHSW